MNFLRETKSVLSHHQSGILFQILHKQRRFSRIWDFSALVSQEFDNKIFKKCLIFESFLQKGDNT